jgi:Ca-activated chloride channel family protein
VQLISRFAAVLAALFLMTATAFAAGQTIIILDASGSMWTKVDGQSRIEIARHTLTDVLKTVPSDLQLGFMAYGHRSKTDCSDIQLLVPPAAGTADAIDAAASNIQPKGMTPLSAAVKQAAGLLAYTTEKATVILITDGLEPCHDDPCALATQLKASGVDFTVDVVGFGLSDSEGKQVACLADNTGGKYFQASDAKGLTDALAQTVAQAAEPAAPPPPATPAPAAVSDGITLMPSLVLSEGGPDVKAGGPVWDIFAVNADGTKGDKLDTEYDAPQTFKLSPGNYIVRASWDQAATEQPVTITAGDVAKPVFNLNAGKLVLHPRPAKGMDVLDGTTVKATYPNGETTGYGSVTFVLPAGNEKINASFDVAAMSTDIPLAAGQTIEQDLILGAGHVTANATYSEGGDKVTDGSLTFAAKGSKKKIDGSRDDFGTSYGPDGQRWMMPGDYVMDVTMDQVQLEIPFTVTEGQQTDLDADLNAGIAALTAPAGTTEINVFGVKKDIEGKRKAFGTGYDPTLQTTLPAGDYVAVATVDDTGKKVEAPFTVKAGERTETTIGAP